MMETTQHADNEKELYDACRAYMFRDLSGTRRSPEYNEMRVQFQMHEETDVPIKRHVRRVLDAAPPPARLLDIGCGTGGWSAALALAGYDVVGIDVNEDGIRAARARARRYPDAKQEFHIARGESLPFPDASFDVVVSTQVFEHVPDQEGFARECFRVLRPGGWSLHFMPNYMFPWEPHYRMIWPPRASRSMARRWLRLARRDPRFFDEEIFPTFPGEVLAKFRAAGLEDVRNIYAEEVAAKFDRGSFTRGWLTSSVRVLRRVGLVGVVRKVVLGLEMYEGIIVRGRKPEAA